MKLIAEAEARSIVEKTRPEVFYIPEGRVLSPAARDYLNTQLVRIDVEKNRQDNDFLRKRMAGDGSLEKHSSCRHCAPGNYTDDATGEAIAEKPEAMTAISRNRLVYKDDPRIMYRGKIDSVQALVVYIQALVAEKSGCQVLLGDLGSVLDALRVLMRAEVLGEELPAVKVMGLDNDALREQSHDPERFYHVKQMTLPDYSMGLVYASLNLLRTQLREAEVLAVAAFREGSTVARNDIIRELNRLSSAVHIIMCRQLAGYYK
ncbi:MAG: ATP-binding protein [Lachnospiraceae bacterium]|nr:ATP-binding protein [Lachnospiraceae bacterium]